MLEIMRKFCFSDTFNDRKKIFQKPIDIISIMPYNVIVRLIKRKG